MIIGIDPGVGGAIAWLDGSCVNAVDMPCVEIRGKRHVCPHTLHRILTGPAFRDGVASRAGSVDAVVLEHVQGVQGTGATSAFSFGRSFGVIEGVLAGLELPCVLVRPQRWTKELGVSRDKGSHRAAASRLWPQQASLFARVKDDGRADAALLAHWYARKAGAA